MGEGNPYHDEKTGEFTSGTGGPSHAHANNEANRAASTQPTHSDLVARMSKMRDGKPPAVEKLWNDPSSAPPAEVEKARDAMRKWQNEYNKINRMQKRALVAQNEAFRLRNR